MLSYQFIFYLKDINITHACVHDLHISIRFYNRLEMVAIIVLHCSIDTFSYTALCS